MRQGGGWNANAPRFFPYSDLSVLAMEGFKLLAASMQKKPFAELGLSPELLEAVAKMGFEEASPIQSAAIPVLLEGGDVVGQSQTGSGKTAAFAIPAIEKVDPGLKAPQVIILCPTRELAVQISQVESPACICDGRSSLLTYLLEPTSLSK